MDVLNVVSLLMPFIGLSTAYETCYKKEVDYYEYYHDRYKSGFQYKLMKTTTCYGNKYCCSGNCCGTYEYTTYYEISGRSIAGISFGCILGFSLFVAVLRICCRSGRTVTNRRTVVTRRGNIAVIHTASSTTSDTAMSNQAFTDYSPPAYSEPPPSYTDVMAAELVLKPQTEQTLPNAQRVGFEGLQNPHQQLPPSNSQNVESTGLQDDTQQQTLHLDNAPTYTPSAPYPQY